jgi:uncharacterized protein YcbX
MSVIGTVDSLWRYPVKSMRGESLNEAFLGFSGVYGDRLFALKSSKSPRGFPYLTGRELHELLLYRPAFLHAAKAAQPPNLADAESLAPGLNPEFADSKELAMTVQTPSGEIFAIDDPALIQLLEDRMGKGHKLSLVRSERSLTDCRPVSLFSIQTGRQLGIETGTALDHRRFRANVYLDLDSSDGFAEDTLVGKALRLGPKVIVSILERDPRCAMIAYDPDTAALDAEVLRNVSKAHEGMAGVYAAVLVEGIVRKGDEIEPVS